MVQIWSVDTITLDPEVVTLGQATLITISFKIGKLTWGQAIKYRWSQLKKYVWGD